MNVMLPPAISEVASLRMLLWDAGFAPVALKTGDKMPVVNGWPDRARRDPLADVEDVPTSNALNTGLLADGLRIIDLDLDDADTAHRLRALAGSILDDPPCIMTRSNSSRVAILYRAADGAPKKISEKGKLGGLEVLGRGNQLHAYGPHPSDGALIWETPPHETPIDRLPAVTEAQIATFLAAAALLIGAEPEPEQRKAPAAGEHQSSARGAGADPLDVTAALAEIPNDVSTTREYWNRVGMATYAATGGSEAGLAAWCEWSRRHPTHNPDAMRKKWEDYKTSPPRRIGAGLLFHMATEARPGWKKPSDTMQHKSADQLDPELLANPDMSVLRLGRRAPPELPLDVFGPDWSH